MAQTFETRTKDPADKLDYLIDWRTGTQPFLGDSEVITASTWTAYTDQWVATDDLVVDTGLSSHTDTTATVWVSGGTAGKTYFVTDHIVTSEGREKDLSIKLICKEQ